MRGGVCGWAGLGVGGEDLGVEHWGISVEKFGLLRGQVLGREDGIEGLGRELLVVVADKEVV